MNFRKNNLRKTRWEVGRTGEDGGAGGKWTLQAFLELPEDLKGAGNNARLKAVLDAVG